MNRTKPEATMTQEQPPIERARAYVTKIPSAISGTGGHNQTFAVACKLAEFGLPQDEAWQVLLEYNERCVPAWSESDLRHKLQDAYRKTQERPDNFSHGSPFIHPSQDKIVRTPEFTIDPVTATENYLKGFRCDELELWEVSPVRPPDDWTQDANVLLEALFKSGEQINFLTDYQLDGGKAKPDGFGDTVERDMLIARFRKQMPQSEAGGWLRMNPMDGHGVCDVNVKAFRFALVECDTIPIDLQMALLAKLPLPISAILTSGGRSLHAWVRVDANDLEDYRQTVSRMLGLLAKFGVCDKNKNPSRMSRLVGVERRIGEVGDCRQRLIYLNPNPNPEPKAIL
jgi:hypothetical protein